MEPSARGTQVGQNSARAIEARAQDSYGVSSYATSVAQQLPLQSDYGVAKPLEFVDSGLERNHSPLIKQGQQHSLEVPSPWLLNHTPTSESVHCSHPLMKDTRVYSPPNCVAQLFPGDAAPIFVESPFFELTQRQQPCPPLPPRAVVSSSHQHSYSTSLQSSHPPSNETSVSSPSTHVPETLGPTAAMRRYSPSNRLKEGPNLDEPACSMQSASLNMTIPASLPMRERIHEKRAQELQSSRAESELFHELVHSLMGVSSFHRPHSTSAIDPQSANTCTSTTMSVAKSESSERVAFTPPDSPPPSGVTSTFLQSSLGRNQTSLTPTNPEIKSPSTEFNQFSTSSRATTAKIPSSSVSQHSRTSTAIHSPAYRATTQARKLRVPVYSQFKHHCYTASPHSERHEFAAPSLPSSSVHFPSSSNSGFHRRDEYSFEDFEDAALDTKGKKKESTLSTPSKSSSTSLREQKPPGLRVESTKRQRRQESSLGDESNDRETDTPCVKASNLAERISLRRARKGNFIRIEPFGTSSKDDNDNGGGGGGGGGDNSPATPTCVVKASDDGVQGSVPKLLIKLGRTKKTSGVEDGSAVATLAARGGKKVEMKEESDSDWEFPAKRYKKSGKKPKKHAHRDDESHIPSSSSKYTQPENQLSKGEAKEGGEEGSVTYRHLDDELKAEEMCAMERLKFFECSVHSDMPKGTFLVAKEDALNEHCCLWKIDSANLLQKYVPVVDVDEDDDATRRMLRYRSVSAFTGWCPSAAADYIAVEVDQLGRSRSEAVVQPKHPINELLPAWSVSADDDFEQTTLTLEAPETPLCRGMANTIEEPIRLFLEAMLRHACSLKVDFIQKVKAENDFRYLNALNEVDRRNSESKEKIKGHIKLCGHLERSLQSYAGYYGATEDDGELAHQNSTHCQNCGSSDVPKLRLALLFGNLVNEDSGGDVAPSVEGGRENNLLRTGTPPSTEDIVLCEVCERGACLYHKLHHMPYQVFKKCEDQLEAICTRYPDLDQEEAIRRCAKDNVWSQGIIFVYESAWHDAAKNYKVA